MSALASILKRGPLALPLSIAAAISIALCSPGCAGSDDVPSGTGATTQTLPPPKDGDALPGGAISFFNTTTCPTGWAPFEDGAGRIVVPTTTTDPPLIVKGTPLKDGEDRVHGHSIDAELTLTAVSYVGLAGGGNGGVAGAQTIAIPAAGEKASSGLPYVQLLACKKLGATTAGTVPVPRGLIMFYNGDTCPAGWTQPMATQGRVLVGLPEGATSGITFGGTALKSGESRMHNHKVSGMITTTPHGIALGSGCCGDGYAKDGAYPYEGAAGDVAVDLPTVQVLQCQKD